MEELYSGKQMKNREAQRQRAITKTGNRGIEESGNRGIGESRNRGIEESGNRGIGESRNIETSKPIYQFYTLYERSLRKYLFSKTKAHTSTIQLVRFQEIPKLQLNNENWHASTATAIPTAGHFQNDISLFNETAQTIYCLMSTETALCD